MSDKLKKILRKMCDKRFCKTEYSYCIENDQFCDRAKVVLKKLGELLDGSGDKKLADLKAKNEELRKDVAHWKKLSHEDYWKQVNKLSAENEELRGDIIGNQERIKYIKELMGFAKGCTNLTLFDAITNLKEKNKEFEIIMEKLNEKTSYIVTLKIQKLALEKKVDELKEKCSLATLEKLELRDEIDDMEDLRNNKGMQNIRKFTDLLKELTEKEKEIAKLREDSEFIIRQDKLLFGKDAVKEIAELTTEVKELRKTNEMLDATVEQDMADFQREMDENERLKVKLTEKEKELDEWRTRAVGSAADRMICRKETFDLKKIIAKLDVETVKNNIDKWAPYLETGKEIIQAEQIVDLKAKNEEQRKEIVKLKEQLKREEEYETLMQNQIGVLARKKSGVMERGKRIIEKLEIKLVEAELAVDEVMSMSKEELKRRFGDHKPEKPEMPKRLSMIRLIREGDLQKKCPECGSSLKWKFFGFGKSLGCIQPECSNYYKSRIAPILPGHRPECLTIAKGLYVKSLSEGNMAKKRKHYLFPSGSRFSIDCVSLQDPDFTMLIDEEAYRILINKTFDNASLKFDLILQEVK